MNTIPHKKKQLPKENGMGSKELTMAVLGYSIPAPEFSPEAEGY